MIQRTFSSRSVPVRPGLAAVVLLLTAAMPVAAQTPNVCDPGEFPDVIVGDLYDTARWGEVDNKTAFSVATTSCNVGTCWLNWISNTNEHPVIGQNMYRLKDGRFEQIGQSWLKHGFFALSGGLCSNDCESTSGSHLGVNCSDPYSAGLNGSQGGLGPKWEVNPSTGEFPYPATDLGLTGDAIYKRLQVDNDDLDPALNPGALYFVEGHYVTSDDAAAGMQHNNASYRPVNAVLDIDGYNIELTGETKQQQAAIHAWKAADPGVKEARVDIPGDGRFNVAARATEIGGGIWRYEYAVHNMNSHRAMQSFTVPVPAGALVDNIDFDDVDYHSGEPFDGLDWTMTHDQILNRIVWSTKTYDEDPNANALRWGTLYNFGFDSDASPTFNDVTLTLFRPGDPTEATAFIFAPNPCNNNGTCEPGETCLNCAGDCVTDIPVQGFCGNGICEISLDENCDSCPSDCNGVLNGNPGNRFCCGSPFGSDSVGCSDSRCTTGGFSCGELVSQACCGDATCDESENSCICAADCGAPPIVETACADGVDEDCDGQADCTDLDCCTDAICADGIDADADGVAECDCDDNNNQVWATPGEVESLELQHDLALATTTLTWLAPLDFGGTSVRYETIRSDRSENFDLTKSCLSDVDPLDPLSTDVDDPASGDLFHYLIRAVNDCPAGNGPLGNESSGATREVSPCP